MQLLKQSTSVTVLIGPILDSSGAAVTGAVIADLNITKNGSTAAMSGNTFTHSHNGHYLLTLTTTDTNTLGRLAISANNSAHAMPVFRFTVLVAAMFDAIVTNGNVSTLDAAGVRSAVGLATANLDTQLTTIDDFLDTEIAAIKAKTDNLPASFPTNFGSLAITVGGAVTAGTVSDKTGYSLLATTGLGNQTANITGNLSGSVGSVTGNVGGNVVGSVGSIGTGGIASTSFAAGAITATAIAADAIGASELAADAIAEIADGVWDELLSGHSISGSAGSALSTASSGGVDPAVLADAIWDEALSGHLTTGTTGKALSDTLADTNELQTDWANGGRLDLLLDQALAAAVLARQILGNKHTVVNNGNGTYTITVRDDTDSTTVRTIVYTPATGARTAS